MSVTTVTLGPVESGDDVKVALLDELLAEFKRRDLTQSQAAELLGVKQSRISELANRRLRSISIDRLLAYSDVFGIRAGITITRTDMSL